MHAIRQKAVLDITGFIILHNVIQDKRIAVQGCLCYLSTSWVSIQILTLPHGHRVDAVPYWWAFDEKDVPHKTERVLNHATY